MKLGGPRSWPKELNIGDQVYKLQFVRKILGEGQTLGICDPTNHVIKVKLGQSLTETFNTIVHEVIHALEAEYEFELPHPIVYKLERAISDFLVGNF